MNAFIILLFCVTCVDLEVQSVQYQMHVSRKSRSNSAPLQSGYIYSQINNNPATFAAYGNDNSGLGKYEVIQTESDPSDLKTNQKIIFSSVADKYNNYLPSDIKLKTSTTLPSIAKYSKSENQIETKTYSSNFPNIDNNRIRREKIIDKTGLMHKNSYDDYLTPYLEPPIQSIESSILQSEADYEVSKALSKYNSDFMPSKIQTDLMYDKLKAFMHYRPAREMSMDHTYNYMNDFHIDDNDIRTGSRSSYDSWPYFYHTPYEYEYSKHNSDVQKAKDKRYAVDTAAHIDRKVIPVHEYHDAHEHDNTNYYHVPLTKIETSTVDTNPISGHQPFFSFVLHDYNYDKPSNDDDPLTFKGLDIDEDVYYDTKLNDENDEYGKRNRRLQNTDYPVVNYKETPSIGYISNGNAVTEKGYFKDQSHHQHNKGSGYQSNDKKEYDNNHNKFKAFKDFADAFTNKFGSTDHNKNSHYSLKTNQDKGEKRKGFRRVYHKDEYQEDNEFYDNNNTKVNGEENANSSVHKGGSEAFLKSQATASVGDKSNKLRNSGNTQKKHYEKNKSGHDTVKGSSNNFRRYQDEAKKTALSNSADYIDHFNV